MRKYIDIVSESPIADFEVVGELGGNSKPNGGGTGYTKEFDMADWKVTHSEKAIAKIFRIWEKTPYIFNYIIIFSSKVKNKHHLTFDKNMSVEKLSEMVGKPVITDGRITMVMYNHVAGQNTRMPISAWTLAHRFGHAIHLNGDYRPFAGGENGDHPVALVWSDVASDFNALGLPKIATKKTDTMWAALLCTFKSARDDNMNSPWEIIADLFAQYLITGRIRLNRWDAVAERYSNFPIDAAKIQTFDALAQQGENALNKVMKETLDGLVGKIVGF